jgi:hypothetical protein
VGKLPKNPDTGGFRQRISKAAKNTLQRVKQRLGISTTDIGAGRKGNETEGDTRTDGQKAEQKTEDPNSQHSPEGKERTKKNFMEKVKNGAIGALAMLPLAVLLAAIVQGGIDCDNIDKAELTVTNIDSAAWPDYPDWWPDWAPAPQSDTKKVWISYKPSVHILMTDTINIKTSNSVGETQTSITGDHSILNNDDDSMTLIEIADAFDPTKEDFSNVTAKFKITTDCMDRMAYAAGEDFKQIGEAGSSFFSTLSDALPWRTIMYIIIVILVVWLFIKGVSIARS